MHTQEDHITKQKWFPKKERIWIVGSIIVSTIFVLWQLWSMLHLPLTNLHSRSFENTFKKYGSNARIALFFVLANYALACIVKQRIWGQMSRFKKWTVALLRLSKRWHTPFAILAIALISLHTVGVFMYGFKFNFNHISGLLALLVLLPVPVSGLFRYRKLDRKWHLRSGLAFAVLFLIHAFL